MGRANPASIFNPNLIVCAHLLEQLDDFEIFHLHATGAGRSSEPILVIGAVNINIAGVGVDVATGINSGFQSP